MLCHYDEAERWCRQALDAVPTADDDRPTWVMATRVLGLTLSAQGRPDDGADLCQAAVAAAPTAQIRSFASLYLAHVLIDAGRFEDAVAMATNSILVGENAGIDRSSAGYFTAVACEALIRLGRLTEAESLLATHDASNLPVGDIRLARSRALLTARLGDHETADALLAGAESHAVDPWHPRCSMPPAPTSISSPAAGPRPPTTPSGAGPPTPRPEPCGRPGSPCTA